MQLALENVKGLTSIEALKVEISLLNMYLGTYPTAEVMQPICDRLMVLHHGTSALARPRTSRAP